MVFFYLVTTSWMFDISPCKNSIKITQSIIFVMFTWQWDTFPFAMIILTTCHYDDTTLLLAHLLSVMDGFDAIYYVHVRRVRPMMPDSPVSLPFIVLYPLFFNQNYAPVASRALSLRNVVSGYECRRVFPAGVGLGCSQMAAFVIQPVD